ncbi:MAG: diaminopimelate epimerase [Planctomyces sp.]|nr:diaminopimelate epimerase [Planctomyces sp.]
MASLSFIKMHGCGNDYVYLDGFSGSLPVDLQEFARRVSDRHTGIGSDGLVVMLPPDQKDTHARMRMFNSDGSEGSMCGNALRCMAMWLFQSGLAPRTQRISIASEVVSACVLESSSTDRSAVITIDMGIPSVMKLADPARIFLQGSDAGRTRSVLPVQQVLVDVPLISEPLELACVSMGNPHAVVFVDSLANLPFSVLGPFLETHSLFPDRANIEFVQVISDTLAHVRVWERGSGETRACGSGACAVAAAGFKTDRFSPDQLVTVQMMGGSLLIRQTADQHLHLTGPAQESFRGTL